MLDSLLELTLEQQIGQLFCIGLPGTEIDEATRKLISDVSPGGVIIFGRNVASPEQLRQLTDELRSLSPITPIIGIDQEGGLVDRLRRIFTPMPSARTIRQHGDLAGARALGRITGEVLRMLGFNLNFAPVMSIMTDDRDLLSNGLYSRSFGRSPGEVLGYTMVYLRALQGTGLIGCLKHFPGIGSGEVDSHEGGRLEPASLSSGIVTSLLRDELGYKHVVLTDDLEMGAISKHYEIEEAARRAFYAGQDVLLICSRPDLIRRGYESLLSAARSGEITPERLSQSLTRIAELKSLFKAPQAVDGNRYMQFADDVTRLNNKLNYTYGGTV